MIVGASGENIYPEEIESIINNFRFVVDSLVVQQKGKLVALVQINMEELEKKYQILKQDMTRQVEDKVDEVLNELQHYVNSQVNKSARYKKLYGSRYLSENCNTEDKEVFVYINFFVAPPP